jgi:hypothetical protein
VAARPQADAEALALLPEARELYARAEVVPRAVAVAAEQRRLAAGALAECRLPRLREVLEFLLDLAVPDAAPAG